jgi:4-amino-4-deoxy-L-arabinose transferase-like glycosyltransferase
MPLIINKLVSEFFGTNTYDLLPLQGRFLSAIADLLIIFVIFWLGKILVKEYGFNRWMPYWAGLFYTLAVLPIQLSHFFTTDLFVSLFILWSILFAVKFGLEFRWRYILLTGVSFGLALANKINSIYVLPLLFGVMLLVPTIEKRNIHTVDYVLKRSRWGQVIGGVLLVVLFILVTYATLRVADPNVFNNSNWLDPRISREFVEDINTLKSWSNAQVWFPPAIQWISKPPVVYSLFHLAVIGLGLPIFLLAILGIGNIFLIWCKNKRLLLPILLVGWVGAVFLYQSVQFVKALRYFIFLYPLLAIFAGIGVTWGLGKIPAQKEKIKLLVIGLIGFLVLIWPMMFMSVYIKKFTRISASRWIYENVPAGSTILSEHWDDALPVTVDGRSYTEYTNIQLPVFNEDTKEKWVEMDTLLSQGDYLVLSSNRGWGSIPTVPERYPQMTKFYEKLFNSRLDYMQIAEFTSYPSLEYLGIPLKFVDDFLDETFTVYDHPKVIIFKKI